MLNDNEFDALLGGVQDEEKDTFFNDEEIGTIIDGMAEIYIGLRERGHNSEEARAEAIDSYSRKNNIPTDALEGFWDEYLDNIESMY